MSRRTGWAVVSLFIASLSFGGDKPPEAQNWDQKMMELYGTLATLLTDVSSDARYFDPKVKPELRSTAQKLAKLAHDLNKPGMVSPDRDPSVAIFGKLFADESQFAVHLLKDGNDAYARDILRGMSNYCVACHTRTKTGPQFEMLPLSPTTTLIKPIDRGEFFAASRQFDRALKEFDTILSDLKAPAAQPIEWNRAVKYSLAIAVRVKQSPDLAGNIVQRVIDSKDAPLFVRQDAQAWRESITAWRNEPQAEGKTEEGLYAVAVKLLGQAHELQKYPADHSADLLYLRASSAVHDLLQLGAKGRYTGQAYLMAGMCYDVVRSFHVGEIHEIYYERCIQENAHTPLSEACFHRYEQAVYEGFTGSGGVNIPDDLKDKLRSLEQMSVTVPAPIQAKQN